MKMMCVVGANSHSIWEISEFYHNYAVNSPGAPLTTARSGSPSLSVAKLASLLILRCDIFEDSGLIERHIPSLSCHNKDG